MPYDEPMHDYTARLAGSLVTADQEIEREFEARLIESSTLAFRVAYGLLKACGMSWNIPFCRKGSSSFRRSGIRHSYPVSAAMAMKSTLFNAAWALATMSCM